MSVVIVALQISVVATSLTIHGTTTAVGTVMVKTTAVFFFLIAGGGY